MRVLGPVLYAVLFVIAIPAALVWWAVASEPLVTLPAAHWPLPGIVLCGAGGVLWITAVVELAVAGGGLPMNAYPPPRLVTSGPYRHLSDPIYVGVVLVAFGVALAAGSAAGLWLVAPAVALALAALVIGYERPALRRRFAPPVSPALASRGGLSRWTLRAWAPFRNIAERIANSWREWRFGPVRVISHAVYAGAAGALCFGITAALAAEQPLSATILVAGVGLLGAGIWAQLLESASGLMRPFGYYGGVLGAAAALAATPLLGADARVLLGALAVAAPWVQATGRLRCLVQGCCHGAPTTDAVGIRYHHPRSRVSYLAQLAHRPLHATPMYSILGNIVVGVLVGALWLAGARVSMVAGVYLLASGIARFVEESYRGEPQTPVVAGLRVYQWLAVASAVIGAFLTTRPWPGAPARVAPPDPPVLVGAVAFGLVCAFAMGVDFPASGRRFSRLAT